MRDHLMMGDSMDQMSLVEKLESSNPDVRDAAARALQGSTITDDFAAMHLVQNLESRNPDLRAAAAYALEGTTITDPQVAHYLATVRRRLETDGA